MLETVENIAEASRRFEVANEEFNLAVRRVAGPQATEIPDPDLNKGFEEYVELLKDHEIQPDLSQTSEGDELLTSRREFKRLNSEIHESHLRVIQLSQQVKETYNSADVEELQNLTEEVEIQKKTRDDLAESIKDLYLNMNPAVAFRVLEDSFSDVKSAWGQLNSLSDDFAVEAEASHKNEEAQVEQLNLELAQLIKNDPLDADS